MQEKDVISDLNQSIIDSNAIKRRNRIRIIYFFTAWVILGIGSLPSFFPELQIFIYKTGKYFRELPTFIAFTPLAVAIFLAIKAVTITSSK